MNKIIKEITMINTEDSHSKVWRGILFKDNMVITEWGRLDAAELQFKEFPNAGEKFLDKKIAEKTKKGYEPID